MVTITLSHRIYLDSIIIHKLVGNHVATTLSVIKGPNRRYSVSTNGTLKAERKSGQCYSQKRCLLRSTKYRSQQDSVRDANFEWKGKEEKVHEFRISFLTNLWANFQVIILIISLNLLYSILFSYSLSSDWYPFLWLGSSHCIQIFPSKIVLCSASTSNLNYSSLNLSA